MSERRNKHGHLHAEAFCLMTYASDDFVYCERIWNSRDGVTPFVIRSRDGCAEMTHVEWEHDRYLPEHTPRAGERVFVDLTPEVARAWARKTVERQHWEDPSYLSSRGFSTKEEAVAALEKFVQGTPMTIVVEEWPPAHLRKAEEGGE